MAVYEIFHPLVRHKLGRLREKELAIKDFRALVSELGICLAYEATRDLRHENKRVTSWSGSVEIAQVKEEQITIVPILRAGMGMVDGVLKVIPGARISVVGLYRDEKTLEPVTYFEKLVHDIDRCKALILDPMVATGGTLVATIDLLKKAGCRDISGLFLVAAPEGIAKVRQMHPEVDVYVAMIDERLNHQGYILPGIGDAGDRFFGAP